MSSQLQKLSSVLIFHTLLYLCFLVIADSVGLGLDQKAMLFALGFSVVYFLFIWNALYSRPYHHYLKSAFRSTFSSLATASLLLISAEFAYVILTDAADARALLLNDVVLVAFYFLVHIVQYLWIIHLAKVGFFSKNVLLVGSYDDRLPVEELFQDIHNSKKFVGQLILRNGAWLFRSENEGEFVPTNKSLEDFIFSKNANELILCIDEHMTASALGECAGICSKYSIGYYLIPDIEKLPRQLPWNKRFRTVPYIERYCPNRDSLVMVSLKRGLDIVLASCALLVLWPVGLALAALIRREDGGPIFYVSKRVGIHGRLIDFYKFRSMVPKAEALKKDLLKFNERPDGPLFKMPDDPRVTKIGRFLRKTSLDEIPQFWNVLKGDMSLIGPRPHLPEEVASYTDRDRLRLECIPGISCLPQVRGRNTLGFREWVDLDLEYRKNWTILYDFQILFQTALVILRPLVKHR